MPIIQCDIREGRTREQVHNLVERITAAVAETIDAPREYIYVIVRESPGFQHYKSGAHLPDFQQGGGATE